MQRGNRQTGGRAPAEGQASVADWPELVQGVDDGGEHADAVVAPPGGMQRNGGSP